MVNAFCSDSLLYKTPKGVWELFDHLSENSHLHATSSHSDLTRQLASKGGIHEVLYSIDLSSKVNALTKKFDQLFFVNKVSNTLLCNMCVQFVLISCMLLLIVLILISLIV